ncbi:TPA: fimbria/pilus outer membrane usher protein [Vibrio parahaemolyticus]
MKKLLTTGVALIFPFHALAEYDLSFVRDKKGAEAFLSGEIAAGDYLVDVKLNNLSYGKSRLNINRNTNKNSICLSKGFIASSSLPIDLKKLEFVYNTKDDCYDVSVLNYGSARINIQTLTLFIDIPQIYLKKDKSQEEWSYGHTGGVLNYYLRGSESWGKGSNNSHSHFGSFDLHLNHDRWVLHSKFDVQSETGLDSSEFKVSTAVKEIKGDVSFGEVSTRSLYNPDFYFKGVSVSSNRAMKDSHYQIYAPTVSGTLTQTSTITLKQSGRTLYSKVVPSGEYIINDYTPLNNGDIEVVIEGQDGSIKTDILNVSIIPGLLKEGDLDYNFSIGEQNGLVDGVFGFGEVSYGLESGTISLNGLIHSKYSNLGVGVALPLGWMGSLSTSMNISNATYSGDYLLPGQSKDQQGLSFSFKYAKDIDGTTNLQLLTYQYQDEGYVDFSEFNPSYAYRPNKKKSRYEASLRHTIGDAHMTSSLWLQDYRGDKLRESGANIMLSKTFDNNISLSLQGFYQSNSFNEDFGSSVSVSVPFDLWNNKQFFTSTLSYSEDSGASVNSALSIRESNVVSYNLNTSLSEEGRFSTSASSNIRTPVSQLSLGISSTNNSNSIYANISGSIVGAKEVGIAWSPVHSNTVAIAHVDKIKGVGFKHAITPTNSYGNAIIPLTEYRPNEISLDAKGIPLNTEVLTAPEKVVPTSSSIIVKEFEYLSVRRYMLQVRDVNGRVISSGTRVRTPDGAYVGTISSNGVLIATLLADGEVLVADNECSIKLNDFKANESIINEVVCM